MYVRLEHPDCGHLRDLDPKKFMISRGKVGTHCDVVIVKQLHQNRPLAGKWNSSECICKVGPHLQEAWPPMLYKWKANSPGLSLLLIMLVLIRFLTSSGM